MWQIVLVIFNLFILESLLSVDNAAVLAVMVKDLPDKQKTKALRYGLLGAYVFRGICLFLAAYLVKILWLKILGGLYLLYLAYGFFNPKVKEIEETATEGDAPNWAKKMKNFCSNKIGVFWSTVILVEIMDLAFSIDNVFAAVALSKIFWVIMIGVGIGILAMRFVAGWFVKLLEKYPTLEKSSFVVIALLGVKLIVAGAVDYSSYTGIKAILDDHKFDLFFSAIMMLIFFIPLLFIKKGETSPIAEAYELNTPAKGLELPKLTEAQRLAIPSPQIGLTVYQTDENEGIYVYQSAGWSIPK